MGTGTFTITSYAPLHTRCRKFEEVQCLPKPIPSGRAVRQYLNQIVIQRQCDDACLSRIPKIACTISSSDVQPIRPEAPLGQVLDISTDPEIPGAVIVDRGHGAGLRLPTDPWCPVIIKFRRKVLQRARIL